MKPDFLLLGAQKSGTKTLMHYLYQHPQVWQPAWREMRFFSQENPLKPEKYQAYFKDCPITTITGESTPDYLFAPYTAARIKQMLPDARLIVLLRDPAERAISHYYHNCRKGRESLPLMAALDAEATRCRVRLTDGPWPADSLHFAYYERGLYLQQLQQYWAQFDAEQMLILHSQDLWQRPQVTFDQVCDFLHIKRHQPDDRVAKGYGGYQNKADPDRAIALARLRQQYAEPNQQLFDKLDVNWGWNT